MSARFRHMAARLWPDSLFGRLAIILFSGLVAAHVLAFVWIVLDHMAIEDELGNKFAAVDIAEAVAILDYVKPDERPAAKPCPRTRHGCRGHHQNARDRPPRTHIADNCSTSRAIVSGPAHPSIFSPSSV